MSRVGKEIEKRRWRWFFNKLRWVGKALSVIIIIITTTTAAATTTIISNNKHYFYNSNNNFNNDNNLCFRVQHSSAHVVKR